ncbi:WHG domain-containing protein [Microbacterium sp. P06]|uniref:TetR/AcrR family transcriptional regulator n=1 Tax=Microbacterium sp. P06 TaxID=3366949 RepID=UPI00374677D6
MPRAKLSPSSVVADAAALADLEGLDAVTVSAVARRLGVQPASLYEHVRGVDALFDGVQVLALGELGALIGAGVAGRSGVDALRGLAEAHRGYALARPGAWAALQRTAGEAVATSAEAARVADLMLAAVRGYPVPARDLIHAVRFVGATINGFLALTRADAFGHRADSVEDSWAAAVDALDRALNTWPPESAPS